MQSRTHSGMAKSSLALVRPDLALQWHPTMNAPLTAGDVGPSSNKKIYWICAQGHIWLASVNNRHRTGCPECSGKKVGRDNNLAARFPAIATEWHPTKNGGLGPEGVTAGSGKPVWWLCPRGHAYQLKISARTGAQKVGCGYCYGKRTLPEQSISSLRPELAAQWHPTRNKGLRPVDVKPMSAYSDRT